MKLLSTSPSSSSTITSSQELASIANGIINQAFRALQSGNNFQRLYMTTVPALVASTLWYLARTVITVNDDEQSLWVQMWLSQQSSALRRVRRLKLAHSSAGRKGSGRDGRHQRVGEEDGDKEGDGGRFAPPKLDFQPDEGVVTWAWLGWWPVSVASSQGATVVDPYSGRQIKFGYTLTIWLAPSGRTVARRLLFQGRDLWLAKRAKKTEIWMVGGNRGDGSFRIATRPSRPLSSVIVEGDTKEKLREDTIHFLNAENWYIGKGVPYRRGYLLHGPPGCGKTSLITALAGDLRLPIVLIPLNDQGMDDRSLMRLMGEAPRNSLVLIEDIDCALPSSTGGRAAAAVRNRYGTMPVTLSGLLNAIDGVGAQEGRLLFMTTNHLDRLDEALIRPGRVDVKYHIGKASQQGAGELFDQFFNGTSAEQEFSPIVVRKSRAAFVAKIEDGKYSFASLQGVFMEARDDPNKVSDAVDRLVASPTTGEAPTKTSAYDRVMAIEKSTKEALERERKSEEAQRKADKPVVKRLVGNPVHTVHNIILQQIDYCGCFPTFGAPELLATSGVLYYELEVVKAHRACQLGFALKDAIELTEVDTGEGVGDNDKSWAVDGVRAQLWHNGEAIAWEGFWQEGDTIGLAANMDTGAMAVSKNGVWDDKTGAPGLGVVFNNESIKQGVYPAFTASYQMLRYYFQGDEKMKHGPPPTSVWDVSTNKEENIAKANGKETGKETGNSAMANGQENGSKTKANGQENGNKTKANGKENGN